MIDALKPYAEYKESGVPLLGNVPEHWKASRIKNIFRETEERIGNRKSTLLSLTRARGLIPQNEATDRLASVEDLSKYKVCLPGQLVMNRMQAWSGMFAVAHQVGVVSPDYSVFRARVTANVSYFEQLFKIPQYVDKFAQRSKGIGSGFNRLYTPDFGAIPIQVPSKEEQDVIVTFIAQVDRRINHLIRDKRRLIELLNEQKQAIIHRAVTRGLNPNVPLKSSGIPWLGDIPGHWEVRRLKNLAHIKTGGHDTVDRVDDGAYPFYVRSQTVERINTYSFDGEAVLTAGDGAGVGKVFHYVNGKFDYHQRVYKFSNFRELTGQFCFYYLKSNLRFEALDASAKSTVDSLRLPLLQNFPIALPSIDEQHSLVRQIEVESASLETAISRTKRELDLLREYRTRLISDVVTGKLDVRGVVIPAMDVAETLEDIDTDEDTDTEAEDLIESEEVTDADE